MFKISIRESCGEFATRGSRECIGLCIASHPMLFADLLDDRISEYHATGSEDESSEVKLKSKVRRRAVLNTLLHGYTSGIRKERTVGFTQALSV